MRCGQAISLIGLSLKSGKEEVRVVLPFVATGFVGIGEPAPAFSSATTLSHRGLFIGQSLDIDPITGDVFAVGLQADNQHHIYRVNPTTGALK